MKRVIPLLAILGMFVIGSMNLHAATLVVSEATDAALRNAIANAAPGDTISFDPALFANAPVTLVLSGPMVIDKELSIVGPGADRLIVDGNLNRIFLIRQGSLRLENINLTNAKALGGKGGSGNVPGGGGAGLGGAIFINSGAGFYGLNVSFIRCSAEGGSPGPCLLDDNYKYLLIVHMIYAFEVFGIPTGGGGGMIGDAIDGVGGAGWALEGNDGKGGDGISYSVGGVGNNGGFGGGGSGSYSSAGGKGGFGGGGGVIMTAVKYSKQVFYDIAFKRNPGGEFGGTSYNEFGGWGASLGGAIFVREGGILYLDHCSFKQNESYSVQIVSTGDINIDKTIHGQAKGGALFVMNGATAKVRNCLFEENFAFNSDGNQGFTYYMQSDTNDVYGVIHDLTDGDIGAFPSGNEPPITGGTEQPTPTVTPIPTATPTPDSQPTPVPQPASIRYEFSGASANENDVTLQGAGFGAYPQADVSFGYLPTDNAFDGATDGQGIIVKADPGEGVMIFGSKIDDNRSALIRCSVRTDQAHADVTIASIGSAPGRFIAVNYPEDESYFIGRYMRLQTFCVPPSTGFQPLIQIVNTSQTEPLTAYIDNLEIYPIDPHKYYSGAFLDGDEVDPPVEQISLPINSESGMFGFDENPYIPEDFTVVPHPGSNTEIDISWSLPEIKLDVIYVQRSTTGGENDWYSVAFISPSENLNIRFTDSNLTPNTLYSYRLLVINVMSAKFVYSEPVSVYTNP